jgi:hypothetical protein
MPNSNTKKMFDHRVLREWGVMKGWDVMATPNQTTFPQVSNFLEFLNKQRFTTEQFQNVLENGDLVKQMLNCPNLSKVDRVAFSELLSLKSALTTIPWTPIAELVDRIMKRSEKRGWGFTKADAEKLAITLHDHFGDLYPTSVRLWLGKDLKFNWSELMLWIKDEVEALGYEFKEYFDVSRLSFFPGSEMSGKRSLAVVDLDLQTFWNPKDGIVVRNERPKRKKWPGLEVAVLLALNPQIYILMDGKVVPYMLSTGLVVVSYRLPYFYRDDRKVYVYDYWDDNQWYDTAMVAFREC